MRYPVAQQNTLRYDLALASFLGEHNDDARVLLSSWLATWEILRPVLVRARPFIDHDAPRASCWPSDPTIQAKLDSVYLRYIGGSSPGSPRLVVPLRLDSDEEQRMLWAYDSVADVVKQYHLPLITQAFIAVRHTPHPPPHPQVKTE